MDGVTQGSPKLHDLDVTEALWFTNIFYLHAWLLQCTGAPNAPSATPRTWQKWSPIAFMFGLALKAFKLVGGGKACVV